MLKYLPSFATPTMRTQWSTRDRKAETLADSFRGRFAAPASNAARSLVNNRHRFGFLLVLIR